MCALSALCALWVEVCALSALSALSPGEVCALSAPRALITCGIDGAEAQDRVSARLVATP